jgi:hypothetical protein
MVRRSTALLDAGGAAHQCILWWADQKPCMVLDLGSARVEDREPGSRSYESRFLPNHSNTPGSYARTQMVIWFLIDPIAKSSCRFYIRNLFGLFSARNQIVIGTNANALQRQL